ncbi:MAG TPA: glycosyltransferase [Terriglobales bacterium]|nr:glycosyltransferase [Terriglobales bacterium]
MTSPRVLHIRASRFVGGPERQILRYAQLANADGITSTIASFVGDGEGDALLSAAEAQGSPTLPLPAGSIAALQALVGSLRATPQAAICTHGYKADILGILAGRFTGTPVISFLRGWTAEDARVRAYESLNRALLGFTQRIVCLSETQRDQMAPYRGQKVRVVTNAVEACVTDRSAARSLLRERFKLPANAMVVASAGRLSPEKGTSYLVEAAKALVSEFPAAHFIFFGDGVLRPELEARAAETPNLYFAGHCADFRDLVAGLDLLVNPSLAEEMPNVVMEAMAAGVPVVATAVGGVPEIASAEGVLKLIPPQSVNAMVDSVRALLADPATATALGEAGRQRMLQSYSPARQQQQLLEVLADFLPPQTNLAPLPASPFISIVIPVRNEERHLGRVLQQLAEQEYPAGRYEILVADGNSNDSTREVVEYFARQSSVNTRLLANPKQLSSAGRNVGVLASRGDIVAFIDGHCQLPSNRLLANIANLMQSTGAAVLCRPQPLHADGNTQFQEALAHTRATIIGHGRDSTIFEMQHERFVNPTSSGAIYRVEVFEQVGLYDENFDACEDVEFNHRVLQAGFFAYSSPRIAVNYSPRTGLRPLWRQLVRYGRGRYRFMRKHQDGISLAQLVPAVFILWLTASGVAGLFMPTAAWAFLGTLLLYGVVTIGFAIQLSFRYGWLHLLISPAVYGCIHGGLGVGFWREALFGRKPQSGSAANVAFRRNPLQPGSSRQDPRPEVELTSATSNKG